MPKRILSTSRNVAVLRTRNLVLQSAGYEVVTTRDSDEFIRLLADEPFDAVVLGDSIDLGARIQLAGKCRQCKPHTPVIAFFKTPAEAQQLLPYTHSLIGSLDGPERLIDAVRAAVGDENPRPARPPQA
jgi:DNA-binding NtrC family response regulator